MTDISPSFGASRAAPSADAAPPASAPARLSYDRPVALVGGGEASAGAVDLAMARAEAVIAADGGANHFQTRRAALSAVIGDMDSVEDLAAWRAEPGCRVLQLPEQETTDLEKCLYSVDAPLYLGAGFLGARFDHSLGAAHVLLKRSDRRVLLLSEADVIFLCPPVWRARLAPGARVSFAPLRAVTALGSSGLRWPLDGLRLAMGGQIGTSNRAEQAQVSASFDRLGALAILERRFLDAAIDSLAAWPEGAA